MQRVRKPLCLKEDVPRDVIIKFHQYEDKAKIWSKLRGMPPIQYERRDLQVFTDLSAGRQLKPLLEQLRGANIKYSWGFPASLIVHKEGKKR